MNRVLVEYDGGLNRTLDEHIIEIARSTNCDTGCMLGGTMTRDLSLYFDSAKDAMEARDRLGSIPTIRVKIELES
jgi:hypothetical protein